MSAGQQIGLIGSSVRVQSLPTASAATFGEGNRFYTLIGQQAGYITGHTYRTVMANDVYSWEDVRNELMLLALVDGTITADSSIEVALSNFNRQPLVDNLLIVYSNANQYALMKVSAVTSTAATLIVKDNSAANIVSTKGETGVAGVGITNATAGEPIVADGKTTTPITFSFSDGTTKEFNVEAQNGTDGAQGVGVKSITSGTPTVVNDKTNTPILITLTDNTTVGLVVSAENGKDGTSATGQSTTSVMSQKAVTDELNKKANTSDIPIKTSQLTNDSDYATKSYVDTQDNKKLDKAGGSVTGNLTIGGNLIVNGATTSIDSTTLKVSDKLIEVAKDNTAKLTTPAGIVVPKYDGINYGALVIDSDGNAQVGDVKLDSSGNIDVTNSDLQILTTREGLTDGNLVKWDGTKKTLVPDTTVASNASSALSKANANATEISTIKTTYQTKTDNTLGTTSKTVVGAINEVKGTADGANSKASVNATEISNIKSGTTVVKNADHANTASNATNVTTNINGHAITDIFEINGTTVKEATHAGKATSAGTADKVANGLTIANATFDGSKPLTIGTSGNHIEIMGGSAGSPNHVSIGLKYGNLMPSSYNKVTIDGYGFVVDGENVDYLTSQSIKKLNTNNTTAQDANESEAIAGSGTINLHKIAKTGSYKDLLNTPSNATQSIAGLMSASDKTKLDGIATGAKGTITGINMNGESKGTSDVVDLGTVLTDASKFATAAQGTKADNAMPKAGGAFTGAVTVQAPTAEMNPATKQYVDTAINAVKQFEYQVVTELPTAAQATMGKIYLVAHSHNPSDGKPDSYDEFITVLSGSTYKWERIGNTDIDLSEYVPTTRKINNKALSSDITLYPTDVGVTEANFPGLNKTGTVTGVNMNGATKTPSSGVVDLGTVLTDESKFATSAQGIKADNAMPKSGGAFTGNISVPSTITFTDTTNPYIKMTTGGTDFYFQSTSGQFGLGPTWNKATHWDANGNVTFPTTPKVGSSSLALKTDLSGKQDKLTAGSNITISGNTISATVPTVNNGKLTIQKNGTDVATFTANQSTNATANITVPVKVSELTNDSGFTTNKGTVTQVKINGATKSPDSAGLVDLGTGFAKTADLPIKSATLTGTTLYLTL